MAPTSPVHKFLGNFSATLGFVGNFQFVEQLSVHRATSKFLCLDSDSHAPGTSSSSLLMLLLGSTCFYEKVVFYLPTEGLACSDGASIAHQPLPGATPAPNSQV